MVKVSVVIASYNHESYIKDTIQSILSQDFQDYELIITDDGSSDSTLSMIRQIEDPRIKLFHFKHNQGACFAHNYCIKHAQGEYIAMLNSDDISFPNRLQIQVDFLDKNPEFGAVFGLPVIIDETGKEGTSKKQIRAQKVFTESIRTKNNRTCYEWLNFFFYRGNCLCHPTCMIRKKCHDDIGLYDQRYAQLPDFDFWIRLCLNKHNLHVLSDKLVKFRVFSDGRNASGSTSEKIVRRNWEFRRILQNFLAIADKTTLFAIFPEAREYGDEFDDSLIPFVIAKLVLKISSKYNFAQDFALNTIGNLLANDETAEILKRTFNFTYIDFIQMTGKYDIYNHDIKKHPIRYWLGFRRGY